MTVACFQAAAAELNCSLACANEAEHNFTLLNPLCHCHPDVLMCQQCAFCALQYWQAESAAGWAAASGSVIGTRFLRNIRSSNPTVFRFLDLPKRQEQETRRTSSPAQPPQSAVFGSAHFVPSVGSIIVEACTFDWITRQAHRMQCSSVKAVLGQPARLVPARYGSRTSAFSAIP